MARYLLLAAASNNVHAGVGVVTVLLCIVAVAMCASHGRQRWGRFLSSRRYITGPLIEHDMDPRIQPGEDDGTDEQTCVWQKKILMGGKCQLPEFSGIITYDSDGKLITPATLRIMN